LCCAGGPHDLENGTLLTARPHEPNVRRRTEKLHHLLFVSSTNNVFRCIDNCITQVRPEEGTNVATYVLFRRAPSQYSASLYAVPNPILRVLALKTFLLFTVWHQLKYPLKVPGNELWLDIAPLRGAICSRLTFSD
jgi:hypothetical protein